MVQAGFNAGPRHARAFGLTKSYTKKLDDATKADHDEEVIAAMSLCWVLSKAWMPTDVISKIDGALAASGMPRVATRNIPEGLNFTAYICYWYSFGSTQALAFG
jgi:hypothetical protein